MKIIESKLKAIVESGANYTAGVEPVEYRKKQDFSKVGAYLYRVIGCVPLNPTDSEKSSATKESFRTLDGIQESPSIPSDLALTALWCDLVSCHPSDKIVIVYGERGSGKTAAINWLFDKNYNSELISKGITWFRTDILKLYKHSPEVELVIYTLAHDIYVALSHASKDPAFVDIDKPQESQQSFFHHLAEAQPTRADHYVLQLWRELWTTWRSIDENANSMAGFKDTHDEEPRKQFIWTACNILTKAQRDRPGRLLVFSNEFHRFIFNRAPGGVWLIVDGIDNVDRLEGDDRYTSMLKQLRQLPAEATAWYTKFIFVMRGVTYEDFTRTNAVEFPSNPKRHLVEPIEIDYIFEIKPKIAKNPKSRYFLRDYDNAIAELGNSTRYIESLEYFYPQFKTQLNDLISRYPLYSLNGSKEIRIARASEDNPWQLLFNRSVRSYSRNVVSTYLFLLRLFRNQGIMTASNSETEEQWLSAFLEGIRARRRLIAEGSFLAGEDFVWRRHSRGTNPPGRWCPNIFDHNYEDEADYWGGLIALRVLQLLSSKEDRRALSESTIVMILHQGFGYWPEHVKSTIRLLREFGLISADVRSKSSNAAAPEPGYRVRRKGIFVANLSLSDPSVLYFLAEATPVPHELSKRYFRHNTQSGYRNFHLASIRTGTAFIRLLLAAYRIEMNTLEGNISNLPAWVSISVFRNFHFETSFLKWRRMARNRITALARSKEDRSQKQAHEIVAWIDAAHARCSSGVDVSSDAA